MMRGEETSHDRLLWVQVMLQAIEDAIAPAPLHQDTYHQRATAEARAEARAWFNLDNPDFCEVCSLAGLDPEAAYERAMAAIRRFDEQPNHDRKRYGKLYTHNGLTLSVRQWSKRTGIPVSALHHRLSNPNFTVEQALTTPYRPRKADTTLKRMVDGFHASKAPAFGFANFGRALP